MSRKADAVEAWVEVSSCVGKHPYTSPALAHRVARRAQTPDISVYRCPHCGKWHIGHRRMRSKLKRDR